MHRHYTSVYSKWCTEIILIIPAINFERPGKLPPHKTFYIILAHYTVLSSTRLYNNSDEEARDPQETEAQHQLIAAEYPLSEAPSLTPGKSREIRMYFG